VEGTPSLDMILLLPKPHDFIIKLANKLSCTVRCIHNLLSVHTHHLRPLFSGQDNIISTGPTVLSGCNKPLASVEKG
jgi:hypothetical protein